ncbi:hypothetical protein HGRIS_003317 [Hohenbuehelia grisea]|uniref:Uncharacterized protein n=1 Tax=Hohenbuehelia grisea TaxID=104357 RepID=A0ABR3JF33_9AGAR
MAKQPSSGRNNARRAATTLANKPPYLGHNSSATTIGVSADQLPGLGLGLNPGGFPALRQVSDVSMRTARSVTSDGGSSVGTHPNSEASAQVVTEGVLSLNLAEGLAQDEAASESPSPTSSSLLTPLDDDDEGKAGQPFHKSNIAIDLLRTGLSHQEKTMDQMTDLKNELTHTKDNLQAAIRDSKAALRAEM